MVLVITLLSACTAPIGVKRVDSKTVQRELSSYVLTTGKLSAITKNLLRYANLSEDYAKRPGEVIDFVHNAIVTRAVGGEPASRRAMIALAELSFDHATKSKDRRYFLVAAIYSWFFLFPENHAFDPNPFDPLTRRAAELYNRSLTLALIGDGDTVHLKAQTVELPFATITIELDRSSLEWGDRRLVEFIPVSELEVRGLRNRYRARGIGAPLAAKLEPINPDHIRDSYLPARLRLPVTAVLHFEGGGRAFANGALRGRLRVYAAADQESIEIGGRTVPLEIEPTSTLASMLAEEHPLWRDFKAFFAGDRARIREGLASLEPYRPGRIPVVLVHGTFSSSSTWAEILNDLMADKEIREHFQFWTFDYNTGNPIAYSAWLLRTEIKQLLDSLDPGRSDPALRRMIVVGHSQGGLLTKMTVVDSGLRYWRLLSDKDPDEMKLSEESRAILEGALIVEPVPEVERVVFIATPHRGSYLANFDIAKWISRFAQAPLNIATATYEFATTDQDAASRRQIARVSGSLDNMSPGSKFLQALNTTRSSTGL
jgi:pimeloyl-ACP methyl ester carboxylesterase